MVKLTYQADTKEEEKSVAPPRFVSLCVIELENKSAEMNVRLEN